MPGESRGGTPAHPERLLVVRLAVGLLVAIMLAASVVASGLVHGVVHDQATARFDDRLENVGDALERETSQYVEALRGMRSFVEQSEEVTRPEWHGYVASLEIDRRFPAIRAAELAVVLDADDRAAYEATVRNDTSVRPEGYPTFEIHPETGRPEHVVLQYVYPFEGHVALLGFDLTSDPIRWDALNRSRDSGDAVATGAVRFGQDETTPSILLIQAIYSEPGLTSVADRRGAVFAYAILVINPTVLLTGAVHAASLDGHVELFDIGSVGQEDSTSGGDPLATATAEEFGSSTDDLPFSGSFVGEFAGRTWRISAQGTAPEAGIFDGVAREATFALGALFSLLIGGLVYALATSRHRAVQEAAEMTKHLEVTNRRLREAAEFRSTLMNTIAHELSAPLTPIGIQLYLLQRTAAGKERPVQEAVDMCKRNLAQLKRLTDDFKDVARLEAGKLRLDRRPLELSRTIGDAADAFRDEIEGQDIRFVKDMEAGVEVVGDPQRLTQIVYNLLTNAKKFTPERGMVVVRLRRSDGRARVEVQDSGRGLSSGEQERLFRPFSQVHNPGEIPERGTGLGLFIAKGIVEGHGGQIGVTSAGPGKGSTFWFELPMP